MTSTSSISSGQWLRPHPLVTARSHPSVATYKHHVYAFGGGGPQFKSMNSVVRYNPATDIWTDCAPMPSLRSGTMAMTVGDRIYVMGGGFKQANGNFKFLTTVEIYYPERDAWETGPDLLQPHDYPAVAFLDNKIYILAGHHPDATQGGPKTDPGFDFCERLDLASGQWEAIAPMPTPRFALAAATVDGKILAMGGVAFRSGDFDNFTVVESYDPKLNQWRRDDTYTLPWPAAGLGAAYMDDKLYVFGGYSSDDIHNRTACFDVTSGRWQQVMGMPAPVAAMGVTVCDGMIYSVGGWDDDGRTPIDKVYAFSPKQP